MKAMGSPELWLIAGPNGAGKTTLVSSGILKTLGVPLALNPDATAAEYLQEQGYRRYAAASPEAQRECSLRAAVWIEAEVNRAIRLAQPVAVETVLSTDKYLPIFEKVSAQGGAKLIYIGNQDPIISVQRVANRVRQYGHDVPHDKIYTRWHRSLKFLPVFWSLANRAWLYDHSLSDYPPQLVAWKLDGKIIYDQIPAPDNVLWRALTAG